MWKEERSSRSELAGSRPSFVIGQDYDKNGGFHGKPEGRRKPLKRATLRLRVQVSLFCAVLSVFVQLFY
jgi:hypothetical protein